MAPTKKVAVQIAPTKKVVVKIVPAKKVGVVILTYNKAHIFKAFVDSLLAQDKLPDQLVMVDDCSTDGTPEKVRTMCRRWQMITLPRNRGQSHCRNIGVSRLSTDYVLFLDGDITMKPNMISSMEQALDKNPSASIAYCHYDRAGSRVDHLRSRPWDPVYLERLNFVSMISMVRRKDLPVPPLDESLQRYEDWDLWITMSKSGKTGVLVDDVLFTAHYQKGDLSGQSESVDWYNIVKEKHGLS